MSLLQRFVSWARGESDEEEGETERSLFECLPIELYGEIFKHLDVENLKNCKAVCYYWAMGLLASRVLLKKSVSTWNVLNNETTLNQNDRSYFCNCVKIRAEQFVIKYLRNASNGDVILTYFTQLNGFKFITYFEVSGMTITSDILARLISKMDLLISLTTTDIMYFHENPIHPNPQWPNLKTLTIQNRCLGTWPEAEISTIGNYCSNLEYLNFQGFFHQHYPYTYSVPFKNLFVNFLTTLRKNSNTLKSAALNTFRIECDREFQKCAPQDIEEQVHEDHDNLFIVFMDVLEKMSTVDPSWVSTDILVKKLHLGFRLMRTEFDKYSEFFLPFLRTLRHLKEFSLSNVHFPGNGHSTIHELKHCLPVNCRTKFEGVMSIRMRDPHAPPVWNVVAALLGADMHTYLQSPIQGYFDSTVALYKANHNLTLRFVCCNSLDTIDFFTRNIQFLTKIKVDQSGAQFPHKIALDDGDMQRIIRLAIHLTHLCLEFCDLSAITDFGLTGISADACMRMTLARNFELLDGDRMGIPVSGLKNLRWLKLSTVGNQVTDVTAHHGFKGLISLAYFGISKPEMTSSGFQEIRRLFEFNQVVQFDPYTKYQFDCIGSGGTEGEPASVQDPMIPIEMDPPIVPVPQDVAPNPLPD